MRNSVRPVVDELYGVNGRLWAEECDDLGVRSDVEAVDPASGLPVSLEMVVDHYEIHRVARSCVASAGRDERL